MSPLTKKYVLFFLSVPLQTALSNQHTYPLFTLMQVYCTSSPRSYNHFLYTVYGLLRLLEINATTDHFSNNALTTFLLLSRVVSQTSGQRQFSPLPVRQTTQVNTASTGQGEKVNYGK